VKTRPIAASQASRACDPIAAVHGGSGGSQDAKVSE
jgi:hypothetical protein